MGTKKVILYEKYFDFAQELTDEQFGKILKAIGDCFIKQDERRFEELSDKEKLFYKMMKYEIKINFDKYEEICEKRREAGKKSAEKRREIEQMLAIDGNNKNNNKNKNKNRNNNTNNNKNNSVYDFDEIERLALEKRMKKISS